MPCSRWYEPGSAHPLTAWTNFLFLNWLIQFLSWITNAKITYGVDKKSSNTGGFNFPELKGRDSWIPWWKNIQGALADCLFLDYALGEVTQSDNFAAVEWRCSTKIGLICSPEIQQLLDREDERPDEHNEQNPVSRKLRALQSRRRHRQLGVATRTCASQGLG